jgi:D-alanyl-lipoteichoic acid acyltransferase DltB (MBOAT superfamily)
MVAGPIMPSRGLLPQLQQRRSTTRLQIRSGLWLILLGFFKKVVIGDNLAPVVNGVFSTTGPVSGLAVLFGVYAFALQIYCDFSGYTDIARGVAKLLGVELMVNFNRPYLATNPSDFWRRWHISLSQWLRDYLYVPLGGSRSGRRRTYVNLMVTMVLGGLWHGAAWNFILWGAYQGLLLVGHRFIVDDLKLWKSSNRMSTLLSRVLMFHATCYGWLLFRANSFEQIIKFTRALVGGYPVVIAGILVSSIPVILLCGMTLWLLETWARNSDDPSGVPGWRWGLGPLVSSLMFASIVLLAPPTAQSFIYFQF